MDRAYVLQFFKSRILQVLIGWLFPFKISTYLNQGIEKLGLEREKISKLKTEENNPELRTSQ